MRTLLVALILVTALGAHAQEPCASRFDQQQPPEPSAALPSPVELCATLASAASGKPWTCDIWKRLNAQLHVWRAYDAIEGERFHLAARHKDGWHVGSAFFKTWTAPGGGLTARFENWKRQPMGTRELITLELRTKGLDPDHGEAPAEMEEASSITVLCVGDPNGAPKCLTFPTRRHGQWFDLRRLDDGSFERLAQQNEPWHASVRYDVKRSGWVELTKVAGVWETLHSDLSWDAGAPETVKACATLRVKLW